MRSIVARSGAHCSRLLPKSEKPQPASRACAFARASWPSCAATALSYLATRVEPPVPASCASIWRQRREAASASARPKPRNAAASTAVARIFVVSRANLLSGETGRARPNHPTLASAS